MARTVSVVGGGVIGLAVAWRAASAGWDVTLYDPTPGEGASWVAGGMLAPLSEGWPGEERLLDLGAESLYRWPEFAQRLRAASGTDIFVSDATMTVALDNADVADLRSVAEWVTAQGYEMKFVSRSTVRSLEPLLGPRIRAALLAPTELAVDNRQFVDALINAASAADVQHVPVRVDSLDELPGDRVVLAAGAASRALWRNLPVRPVKGEILRMRSRPGITPAPRHTVRGRVHGRHVYLVPRPDGLVVGATQYEASDTAVTVAGVRDLVADAEVLFPAIGEFELAEASAGLRPVSSDTVPLIGRLSERVIAATGHGRGGVLLAPLTADAVLAELEDEPIPEVAPASPRRFPEVVS